MSKKKFVLWSIILVLITSALTLVVSNVVGITLDYKVIISKNEYDELIETEERYSKVERLRDYIKDNFYKDVSDEQLNRGMLDGLFESLDDPYSLYLDKDDMEDFMEQTSGEYGGIGIIVTAGDDNDITIVSPIEDTPGERAKLKSGDKIIKVDGNTVTAKKMDQAVDMMKGEPGTDVTLTILRNNNEFDVDITRELIKLKSVKSRVIENDIGLLRITMFDNKVADEFEKNLKDLKEKDVSSLIIDLRNNPGGSLDQVVEIADILLGDQVIVYTENKAGDKDYYTSDERKVDLPIVVLVNEGSASASEILSGAIKDTDAGTIIGTTTFGKGLVQTVRFLNDDTGFKLTTSEYYTPNGINIHGKGIEPDITVELPEGYYELENSTDEDDTQLQKAIEILSN